MHNDIVCRVQLVHAFGNFAQRNQLGARNFADLIFVGLTDVDKNEGFVLVHHLLDFRRRNFRNTGFGHVLLSSDSTKFLVINQLRNSWMRSAHRALRIFAQFQFPELEIQRIEQQQTANQRLALAENQLDGFKRLNRTDDAGQHSQYSAFGTAWNEARRWRLRVEAAVARAFAGVKYGSLPLEAKDAAVNIRLSQQNASIVHQVPGGEIVRAVDDDVIVAEDIERVLGSQPRLVGNHLHVWIDIADGVAC